MSGPRKRLRARALLPSVHDKPLAVQLTANPAALARALPAPAPGVLVVGSNVDTLHVFTRDPVKREWFTRLEQLQDEARARQQETHDDGGMPVQLRGLTFHMKPHGARAAPFLLDAPEVAAVLVNPTAGGTFPSWTCELRSLHLWAEGAARAVRQADAIAEEMLDRTTPEPGAATKRNDVSPSLHVTRLDLAVDFQGWIPDASEGFIAPTEEGRTRYVTRAQDFAAYTKRRRFTGFLFGRGAVCARLYDKTTEVKGSAKESAMRAVWAKTPGYDPDRPVWRLEFQLRREAITQLRSQGRELSTWNDLAPLLRKLWLHLSTSWLARRAPRTKKDRKVPSPEWAALASGGFAGAAWEGSEDDLYRMHREDLAARVTPQLAGYLSRALAEEIYFAPGRDLGEVGELTLDAALPAILGRVKAHLTSRATTAEEKAGTKVATWDEAGLARIDDLPQREPGDDDDDDREAA